MRSALNRVTLTLLKVLICRPPSIRVHVLHSQILYVDTTSDDEIFPVSRFVVLDMNATAILAATIINFRLI